MVCTAVQCLVAVYPTNKSKHGATSQLVSTYTQHTSRSEAATLQCEGVSV
jgi:hypothetical protein